MTGLRTLVPRAGMSCNRAPSRSQAHVKTILAAEIIHPRRWEHSRARKAHNYTRQQAQVLLSVYNVITLFIGAIIYT